MRFVNEITTRRNSPYQTNCFIPLCLEGAAPYKEASTVSCHQATGLWTHQWASIRVPFDVDSPVQSFRLPVLAFRYTAEIQPQKSKYDSIIIRQNGHREPSGPGSQQMRLCPSIVKPFLTYCCLYCLGLFLLLTVIRPRCQATPWGSGLEATSLTEMMAKCRVQETKERESPQCLHDNYPLLALL